MLLIPYGIGAGCIVVGTLMLLVWAMFMRSSRAVADQGMLFGGVITVVLGVLIIWAYSTFGPI